MESPRTRCRDGSRRVTQAYHDGVRMPTGPVLLLVLLPVCGLGVPLREAEAEGGVVVGTHVRVRGAVDAAWLQQAADLGDALFTRLAADVGRRPAARDMPLELVLHPDRTAFRKAVLAARPRKGRDGVLAALGGWTSWHPCISHVALQADAFDTRRLVIHELVHQFRARTRGKSRRGTELPWYREGVAEWYGWHRRTKQGLAFGAFDVLTRNRRLHTVRDRIARPDWRAYAVGTGATAADYDDAIALVGALRGTEDAALRQQFARYEQDVLERGGGGKTFAAMFGPRRARLESAVRAFWRAARPAWEAYGRGWDEHDRRGIADAGRGSLARPAGAPLRWAHAVTSFRPSDAADLRAGIVLGTPGRASVPTDLVVTVGAGHLAVGRAEAFVRALAAGRTPPAITPVLRAPVAPSAVYTLVLTVLADALEIELRTAGTTKHVERVPFGKLGVSRTGLARMTPFAYARGGRVAFEETLRVDPWIAREPK